MAEGAAVSYLLLKFGDPLLKKALEQFLIGDEIEQIQYELSSIQAFLIDADSKAYSNITESFKVWVNQVRDIAYRMEDVIDTFLVEIEENSPKNSSWLSKLNRVLRKPYRKFKMGDQLKDIRKSLNRIFQLQTNLKIMDVGPGSEENPHLTFRRTLDSVDYVVGLEADKHEVIEQLLDTNITRRMVLSIVGPGGLGKTTLAQKVYNSEELQCHFACCTWLTVSQKFTLNDLLRKILHSIEPEMKEKNPPVTDEDLSVELKSSLSSKKYLIILDDVWTVDLWDQMKISLPDLNNCSRVIITSRLLDVAKAADCNTQPYKLRYLNDDDSQALLFRRAFQQHMQREEYPRGLLDVAKKLTKNCGGLPLALVVLGLILRTKERDPCSWSRFETMDWHKGLGSKCSQVLAMSYKHLGYDLKQCFLYFAAFPDDYKISGKHVARMWMAEGFVSKEGAGTMEDRAEEFLEELAQRHLIQVTEKSLYGCYKYCSMHDLLRDLVIHQAREENFFTVSPEAKYCNQPAATKTIRAAMPFCTLMKDGLYSKKSTRSLLCFGFGENSSDGSGLGLKNYSGFRLLRVLTIEHVDMRNFHCGKWLQSLIHLKHLGFRYCTIRPTFFKKKCFYNLETIDLKGTIIDNPNERKPKNRAGIVIKTLRYLYCCNFFEEIFPLKWDNHTNLQTLKFLGHGEIPKLGCSIRSMRTLGICYQQNIPPINYLEVWKTLKGMLERTEQLVSLSIAINDGSLPFGGTTSLLCHERIQSLHLNGTWDEFINLSNQRVLSVEVFPTKLTKLTLERSSFQDDPFPIVGTLQSLKILRLRQYSYEGTTMNCSTGSFPNLKKLELVELPNLGIWSIEEGAMPMLSHLKIKRCFMLTKLPELQRVMTLQKLLVDEPSPELQKRVQREDLSKIVHIPFVLTTSNFSDLSGVL